MAMGVTAALVVIFIRRWSQTRKPIPAVIMIVAGVLAFVGMGISLVRGG
jgi:uncharacterized membrane protein (UPF0136 family)